MENTLIFLAILQSALLAVLLIVNLILLNVLKNTGKRADDLLDDVSKMLREEVRPALTEARNAVQRINDTTQVAAQTLIDAEPILKTVSQVGHIFDKPTAPLWMDGLRLAMGVFGIIKKKRKQKDNEVQVADEQPEYTAQSTNDK